MIQTSRLDGKNVLLQFQDIKRLLTKIMKDEFVTVKTFKLCCRSTHHTIVYGKCFAYQIYMKNLIANQAYVHDW